MKSEAVEIAKAHEREVFYQSVRDVFTHPAVVAIGGIVLVEYLQSSVDSSGQRRAGGGWMGTAVGTALETALGAYLLAPSVGKVASDIKPMFENISLLGKLTGGV